MVLIEVTGYPKDGPVCFAEQSKTIGYALVGFTGQQEFEEIIRNLDPNKKYRVTLSEA